MPKPQLTKEGRDRLTAQLASLTHERTEARERVKTARKFCDFREDVTYAEAVDAYDRIEVKIADLERTLAEAVIVDRGRLDVVAFGSQVVIRETPDGEEETYRLVGELEADLANGTISASSPLGTGLMGGVVGQTVTIDTPGGTLDFEIVRIER